MLILPTILVAQAIVAQAPGSPRFGAAAALVFLALMVCGILGWLAAAVLGFSRAHTFGPAARWFAFSAVCLLLFHLHIIAFALYGSVETDLDRALNVGAFTLLWVALGAVCAIVGFTRLKGGPRPRNGGNVVMSDE
ncbi:MAG: hypothetical protein ACRD9R_05050 [Pyrinomonadaceae bacterium]